MAYPSITTAEVMNRAGVLNNDAALSIYTYTVQLPYLNSALQELQELFELNEVPVTDETSAVITVPAGTSEFGFPPDTPIANTPYLPSDLIEPVLLWERASGIDPYTPMSKLNVLPLSQAGVQINQFIYYVWATQKIKVLPANQDNDIKMNYIRFLFAQFTDVTGADVIVVVNARSFLEFRLAAFLAEFVGENKSKADALNGDALMALDRVTGISAKGRQNIFTRRRPFRSGFKRRTYM